MPSPTVLNPAASVSSRNNDQQTKIIKLESKRARVEAKRGRIEKFLAIKKEDRAKFCVDNSDYEGLLNYSKSQLLEKEKRLNDQKTVLTREIEDLKMTSCENARGFFGAANVVTQSLAQVSAPLDEDDDDIPESETVNTVFRRLLPPPPETEMEACIRYALELHGYVKEYGNNEYEVIYDDKLLTIVNIAALDAPDSDMATGTIFTCNMTRADTRAAVMTYHWCGHDMSYLIANHGTHVIHVAKGMGIAL